MGGSPVLILLREGRQVCCSDRASRTPISSGSFKRYTSKDSTPKKFSCQAGKRAQSGTRVGVNANRTKILSKGTTTFSNQSFHLVRSKSYLSGRHLTQRLPPSAAMWKDMQGNSWKSCLKQFIQTTPCVDDHQFKNEDLLETVLKCPYSARIGRPDIVATLLVKSDHQMEQSLW